MALGASVIGLGSAGMVQGGGSVHVVMAGLPGRTIWSSLVVIPVGAGMAGRAFRVSCGQATVEKSKTFCRLPTM
jgi:hypothetical protein